MSLRFSLLGVCIWFPPGGPFTASHEGVSTTSPAAGGGPSEASWSSDPIACATSVGEGWGGPLLAPKSLAGGEDGQKKDREEEKGENEERKATGGGKRKRLVPQASRLREKGRGELSILYHTRLLFITREKSKDIR